MGTLLLKLLLAPGLVVLTTLAGLAALAGARRWAGLSSTYEAPARSRERVVSDWDRLSLGEDPTRDNPPGGTGRST